MERLNFLVENLGASQLSYYLIQQLNSLSEDRQTLQIDATVFYDNLHSFCMIPQFAVMQMIEAWEQPGITVATSLATAEKLLTFPGPTHRWFYVWDLFWMRISPRIYEISRRIFTNPGLTLIARSESHKKAIENAFNVEVPYVVENFSVYFQGFLWVKKNIQQHGEKKTT